jgi:RNA polymerase sigma factor (sigma-70 family)
MPEERDCSHIHAQSSENLIEIFRQHGRPQDFEQIVRRFAALVLCECRRVTGNSHDAEDASQLAFLALAMEIKSGTVIHRPGAWLQRVARRQALKIVRSRGRRKRREDAVRRSELNLSDAAAPLESAAAAGAVRDAIDALPERYRLPLVLHYFGGMTLELIAGELKVSRPAIGTRLHRGRKMLAARLTKDGLSLDQPTFGAVLSLLVPSTVIAGVLRATGTLHAPHAASSAGMSAIVGQMLHAVSAITTHRAIRIAVVLLALSGGGSGLAWVRYGKLLELPRASVNQLLQKLQNIFQDAPRLRLGSARQQTDSSAGAIYAASSLSKYDRPVWRMLKPAWEARDLQLTELALRSDGADAAADIIPVTITLDAIPLADRASARYIPPSDFGAASVLDATWLSIPFQESGVRAGRRLMSSVVPEPAFLLPLFAGMLLLRRRCGGNEQQILSIAQR